MSLAPDIPHFCPLEGIIWGAKCPLGSTLLAPEQGLSPGVDQLAQVPCQVGWAQWAGLSELGSAEQSPEQTLIVTGVRASPCWDEAGWEREETPASLEQTQAQ